jgi:hypothetical protein
MAYIHQQRDSFLLGLYCSDHRFPAPHSSPPASTTHTNPLATLFPLWSVPITRHLLLSQHARFITFNHSTHHKFYKVRLMELVSTDERSFSAQVLLPTDEKHSEPASVLS